jgi:hypothetical protein
MNARVVPQKLILLSRRTRPSAFSLLLIGVVLIALSATAQSLVVRTNYKAIVLHYDPRVWNNGELVTVSQVLGYRDIDALCQDYMTFLRKASGGQVSFSIAAKHVLDEFPPESDPNVSYSPENYMELRGRYDLRADYVALCNDPRFQIIPMVEAMAADAIWVFGPEGTAFWETAMAGHGAFWINGMGYPEVNCSRKFVIYGFGSAAHQGVGFMLENTGHMTEVLIRDHIAAGWPPVHPVSGWTTLDLANPTRACVDRLLNDWDLFTVTDSVHWDRRLTSPGNSQLGLSHFPPTACVNYGWSPPRLNFDNSWDADQLRVFGGVGGTVNGEYFLSPGPGNKALLYGTHDLNDGQGPYEVPVILTDADVETGVTVNFTNGAPHAGLLLRASAYAPGENEVKGYYLGLDPTRDLVELARLSNSYTVITTAPAKLDVGVLYRLKLSLRGRELKVFLNDALEAVLSYNDLNEWVDGAFGFTTYNASATFSHLYVTPVITNFAENWRAYPTLTGGARVLSPLAWQGDDKPYNDMDYWYAWWYEHLPKNPGTHEVRDGSGAVLGKALNSWWPYIFDINQFGNPFLPDVEVVTAPADTNSPATPDQPRGIGMSTSSVRVAWSEPVDNIGVTRYVVYRDGTLIRQTPLTYLIDTGLQRDTPYTYTVKALDGTGNASAFSSQVTVRTLSSNQAFINGDFESGIDSPIGWRNEAFLPSAVFAWETNGTGRGGGSCISITASPELNDAKWVQEVEGLVPYGKYRLSGWIKGESILLDQGATVGANLCEFGTWDHSSTRLEGSFDWTLVEAEVFADSAGRLDACARLGYWGNLAGGKVWFDDLALEFVPPPAYRRPPGQPRL